MKNYSKKIKLFLLSLFVVSSYNCGKVKNENTVPNGETDNNHPVEASYRNPIAEINADKYNKKPAEPNPENPTEEQEADPVIKKKLDFIVNSAQELYDKAESISYTKLDVDAKAFGKMFEEIEDLPDSIQREESKNNLKDLQKNYVRKANHIYRTRLLKIMNEKNRGFDFVLDGFNELLILAKNLNQSTGIEIDSIKDIQNKKDELCSGSMTVCLNKCTEYLENIEVENTKKIEDLDDESIEKSISEINKIWEIAKTLEQENPDKLKTFTAEILDKLKDANKLYESIKKSIEKYHKEMILEKFIKPMKKAGLTKEQALIKSKKDYIQLAKILHPDRPNGNKTLFNTLNQIDDYIKYVIENEYDSLNFL